MLRVWLLALALLLLLPATQAGTAKQPEVVDDKDDAGADALDIRAMWFEVTDDNVSVHLDLKGLPNADADTAPCANGNCAGTTLAFRTLFRVLRPDGNASPSVDAYAFTFLEFRWGWGNATGVATIGHVTTAGLESNPVAVLFKATTTHVNLTVARSHPLLNVPDGSEPGAYRLNGTHAASRMLSCSPQAGNTPARCSPVPRPGGSEIWDLAPDDGIGLDYVFAAPPGPPKADVTLTLTSTVTATATVTATSTEVSETLSFLSFTSTPFPKSLTREGLPGPGLGALVLLGLLAATVRRAL